MYTMIVNGISKMTENIFRLLVPGEDPLDLG
jgi:hypothetical protein